MRAQNEIAIEAKYEDNTTILFFKEERKTEENLKISRFYFYAETPKILHFRT